MLRFDGQDIATDRFCLFWFVERAIEFRLRDGLGDPGCRNALNLIFHGSFPPRPVFSGAAGQTQPHWGPAIHDSWLPLRVLLSVRKPFNVAPANQPSAVIILSLCCNILRKTNSDP